MVVRWRSMRKLGVALFLATCSACGGGAAEGGGSKNGESVASPRSPTEAASAAATTAAAPEHPSDAPGDGMCTAAPSPSASAPCADPLVGPGGTVAGGMSIQGKLPAEVIARVVRARMSTFRACYADALKRSPNLRGTVKVKFTIGPDGGVRTADDAGSQIASPDVVDCVRGAFRKLTFPQPEGGTVTVVYPLLFEPG